MAAVIEGDVRKNLLDRTDAEKVFRPWWDLIEDYLLNTLIALGEYWKFGAKKHFTKQTIRIAKRNCP